MVDGGNFATLTTDKLPDPATNWKTMAPTPPTWKETDPFVNFGLDLPFNPKAAAAIEFYMIKFLRTSKSEAEGNF